MEVTVKRLAARIIGALLMTASLTAQATVTIDASIVSEPFFIDEVVTFQATVTVVDDGGATLAGGGDVVVFSLFDQADFVDSTTNCELNGSIFSGDPNVFCPIPALSSGTHDVEFRVRANAAARLNNNTAFFNVYADDNFGNSLANDPVPFRPIFDILTDTDGDTVSDFNENLIGTDPNDANSVRTAVTVDLYVLYSQSVPGLAIVDGDPDGRIQQLINAANAILAASNVELTYRVVGTEQVNMTTENLTNSSALSQMDARADVFSIIDDRKETSGADLVLLMRPELNDGTCGVANLLSGGDGRGQFLLSNARDNGNGTVYIDCRDRTTVHELTHLMGGDHSREIHNGITGDTEVNSATFVWGTGHGEASDFVTVMAGVSTFGSANNTNEVNLFSNPNIDCSTGAQGGNAAGDGGPCGVDRNTADTGAENWFLLNNVKYQHAAYFGIDADTDLDGEVANDTDEDGDGDGQNNAVDTDDDNDGLTDAQEIANRLDPFRNDADEDPDEDTFTNAQEVAAGSDPFDAQSVPGGGEPPVVTAPEDISVEGDTTGGALKSNAAITAFLNGATAVDALDGNRDVTNNLNATVAGDTLPLGATAVTFSAVDTEGLEGSDTATITVVDTTAPEITAPEDGQLFADGETGLSRDNATFVAFVAGAAAEDIVDADVAITTNAPDPLPVGNTTITFTATDDSGNTASDTAVLEVLESPGDVLDIDGDGTTQGLTDGLLLIRYLFGFRGEVLIGGAVGNGAPRASAAEIEAFLAQVTTGSGLDVDLDGSVQGLTDGIMILRRLFGFSGATLTAGAVGGNAQRSDDAEIQAYIDALRL